MGLGVIAPDGSPVDLYRHLPAGDEPEIIHAAIFQGTDVLELGCGTGRVTRRLVELGHAVTAVDQSSEMLQHVRGAEPVLADIEGLDLGRRFGAVVLASHLINEDDGQRRKFFLETCRRHIKAHGPVVIQRYDPSFDWRAREGEPSTLGDFVCTLRDVELDGQKLAAVMEYRLGKRVWKQAFHAALLDDETIRRELEAVGLRLDRWLDDRRSWLIARPVRP